MRSFVLLLLLVGLSLTTKAQDMPTFPFLTVTGEAELKVEPDMVNISFHVIAFDKASEPALAQVNETANFVTEFLLKSGVKKKQITAFNISKDAKRNRDRETYQDLDILGYQVTQRFKVELTNLKKFEDIVNQLLVTDRIENFNFDFDVSNRKSLEAKLVRQAGKDARARAKDMAAGMSVELRSVYAIFEDGRGGLFNVGFDMEYGVERFEMRAERKRTATLNPPEFIELRRQIKVIFKIED